LDAALNYIKNNCDREFLCTTQPANYADANATLNLCTYSMNAANYTGPAAGNAANSRKVAVNQRTGNNAGANGTAAHVALGISGNTTLKYVTTCGSQAVTTGNPIQINAWNIEFDQPS
jgi:hypothetical protein